MRSSLIRLSGALVLTLTSGAVAHADVLVKNKDGKAHNFRIIHTVGRTSTEIPRHATLIISGSEEATAVQLEDGNGDAIGKPVAIDDGDRITIVHGTIVKTPGAATTEN